MPTTVTRPEARAQRLGYGRAALTFPVGHLSLVASDQRPRHRVTPSHVADEPATQVIDPLAALATELYRIHGHADEPDTYILPA